MKNIGILLFVVLLAGCEKSAEEVTENSQRYRPDSMAVGASSRFKVERVSVFRDPLAYNEKRGIYVITDLETKQEFIGVSGVGISELASYQVGKQHYQNER